jgi:hypothetical protein
MRFFAAFLILLTVGVGASVLTAGASQDTETKNIYVEVEGELEEHVVDGEALDQILMHAQYYCKAVPGGWIRCSKHYGSCFGATFRNKFQCERALHPDDD